MALSRRSKIAIGAVAVIVVVMIVIVLAVSGSSQVVNKDDAESTLGNLGYDDATVESCDYLRGTNALNVEMCQLSGTFVSDGVEHTYKFTYTLDKKLITAEIDGSYVDESGYAAYNYKVVKTMTSFACTYSSDGSEYTQTADDGMKYVVVDMITKNVNYDGGISPTAGTIQCITDSNLSYGCDYVVTEEYTGVSPFDYPDMVIGGSYSFILVFEIPEDASINTVGYEYTSLYNWVLDTSLTVRL